MEEKGGFSVTCWLDNEGMLHEKVTAEEGVELECKLAAIRGAPVFLGYF